MIVEAASGLNVNLPMFRPKRTVSFQIRAGILGRLFEVGLVGGPEDCTIWVQSVKQGRPEQSNKTETGRGESP